MLLWCICCALAGELAAQTATDWTCLAGNTDWTSTACWSALSGGDAYPDNGGNTYVVTLPVSAGNPNGNYGVTFNAGADTSITIDGLGMAGADTRLDVGAGRSLKVLGSLTTRGTLFSGGVLSTGPGAVVDVDATALIAYGGGTLTLPIASYTDSPGFFARFFRAQGAGSVLDLPALETISGNPGVAADTGGRIDLPLLTTFDTTAFSVANPGSVLSIPLVTALTLDSKLNVIDRGTVIAGPLVALARATLYLQGGTIGGGPGTHIDLSQVASADYSLVIVEAGATAALPRLTSFVGANNAGFAGNGAGSVLDLSALASMKSTNLGIQLHADNGATLIVSNLTSTSGSMGLQSLGAGSLLRVEGLTSLAHSLEYGGLIRVGGGGKVIGAPFVNLDRTELRVEGPAVASADDYVDLFDTRFVTGLDYPAMDVNQGAKVSFPAVKSIVGGLGFSRLFSSGPGSKLILPSLTTVSAPTSGLTLRAQGGGATISAPALTMMPGSVFLMADGAGSVVELGAVDLDVPGFVDVNTGGELRVHGSFAFEMTDPTRFRWTGGALKLLGGIPADCEDLEVAGEDRGDVPAGWTSNFQLDRLVIGPGARIQLVDRIDNANRGGAGGGSEALYVETLEFADPAGVFETNGLHLYYHSLAGSPAQVTTRERCCVEETTPPFIAHVAPQAGRLLEICPPPGRSISVATSSQSQHSLKARWGAAPTPGEFDEFAGSREPTALDVFENRLLLSATREQSLSILLEGDGDVEVTIEFRDFALADVSPRIASAGRPHILAVRGDDLDRLAGLQLVGPGGPIDASEIRLISPQRAEAVVTPERLGAHDVVAVSSDGLEARLDGWIEVVDESFPFVSVDLVGPDKVRAASDWAGYSLLVENLGCEVPAPLLRIEGHCAEDRLSLPGEEDGAGPVLHVFAPGASLSRLGAGERSEIPILYRPGCCASALCGIVRSAGGDVLRDDRMIVRCSVYVPEADDVIEETVEGVPGDVRRAFPARWRDLYQQVLPAQARENAHRGRSPFSVSGAYRELARRALGEGSGALTGQITQSLTEIPIAGAVALASIDGSIVASATADARGNWAIPCLADGDYGLGVLDHDVVALRGGPPLASIQVRGGETVSNVNAAVSVQIPPREVDYPAPESQCDDAGLPRTLPVPPGQYWEAARKRIIVGRSSDPNDKNGATGEGEEQMVARGEILHYTIECENVPGLEFSAWHVVIQDTLDPEVFDLSTFHFHDVEVAGRPLQRADVLHSSQDFHTGYSEYDRQESYAFDAAARVTILDPSGADPDERDVAIHMAFDATTGLASWEIVDDTQVGFLVPNDTLNQGQMTVSFSIQTRSDLDLGVCRQALNRATITFDDNAPILTPAWRNVIGAASVCSSLRTAPASLPQPPDGQTDVSPGGLVLGWHAALADSADVYLGKAPDALVLLESTNRSGLQPLSPLEPDTRYYWQVVPRDAGGLLCTPGACGGDCCPVWSFTTRTASSPAQPAVDPVPPDGATGVDPLPRLAWARGDALAYAVYLWAGGGDRPGTPIATATASSEILVREPLRPGTTYQWTVISLGSVPEHDSAGPLWSFTTAAAFRRGDANADGHADVSDAIATLGYLFLGSSAITCLDAADADDSGDLNITDAVYLLGHLFLGGPSPPAPGIEDCGADLTEDGLGCDAQSRCP